MTVFEISSEMIWRINSKPPLRSISGSAAKKRFDGMYGWHDYGYLFRLRFLE